jgi:hypothetical protein
MAAKLTRMSHKIATQLHLVIESCTICSSRSRRPVRKLLDAPSYMPWHYRAINNVPMNNDLFYRQRVIRGLNAGFRFNDLNSLFLLSAQSDLGCVAPPLNRLFYLQTAPLSRLLFLIFILPNRSKCHSSLKSVTSNTMLPS